jgi:hypothetical protein
MATKKLTVALDEVKAPRLKAKEIQINESNQVIGLDLSESNHFRIWVNGNYDFDLPMPINGFDGQPFTVEIRGKKMASWDDETIEAWVGFDWRWFPTGLRHMIDDNEIIYNIDENYLKRVNSLKTYLRITNYNNSSPFWILDSMILNDFVLKEDDIDGLSYHSGVYIKSLGYQYPYASFSSGEITNGGGW